MSIDLGRFISLGENCEFGLYQRKNGSDRSSLLRWTFCPPRSLVNGLRNEFRDLYDFANLAASDDSMVLDTNHGIAFHSGMVSKGGEFLQSGEELQSIYDAEAKKIEHLKAKLIETMTAPNIFVYKRQGPAHVALALEIGWEISQRGPGLLLFVHDEGDEPSGVCRHVRRNVMVGRHDRFAPYHNAHDFSEHGWNSLLESATAMGDVLLGQEGLLRTLIVPS
ncbi:MAG: hypothetical protein ABL866_16645 [Devosia sp.]